MQDPTTPITIVRDAEDTAAGRWAELHHVATASIAPTPVPPRAAPDGTGDRFGRCIHCHQVVREDTLNRWTTSYGRSVQSDAGCICQENPDRSVPAPPHVPAERSSELLPQHRPSEPAAPRLGRTRNEEAPAPDTAAEMAEAALPVLRDLAAEAQGPITDLLRRQPALVAAVAVGAADMPFAEVIQVVTDIEEAQLKVATLLGTDSPLGPAMKDEAQRRAQAIDDVRRAQHGPTTDVHAMVAAWRSIARDLAAGELL